MKASAGFAESISLTIVADDMFDSEVSYFSLLDRKVWNANRTIQGVITELWSEEEDGYTIEWEDDEISSVWYPSLIVLVEENESNV